VDDGIEPALQQADQVLGGRALEAPRLLVDAVELPLADVAVVALELLLGAQLLAVVGELGLAPLAVLAGARLAPVDGALRPPPDVLPEAAVDLVLGADALRHGLLPKVAKNASRDRVVEHALLCPEKISGPTGSLLMTGGRGHAGCSGPEPAPREAL